MKNLLLFGGNGSLGSQIGNIFMKNNFKIFNVDVSSNNNFSTFSPSDINNELKNNNIKLDSVICAAGGFDMVDLSSDRLFESYETMMKFNLESSILAAQLGEKYLKNNSTVILTGADAIYKEPQPNMLTYSLSKSAVHHLAECLSKNSIFREKGIDILTILPTIVDNQGNREAMPDSDFSKWLPPKKIAQLLLNWVEDDSNRPKNNSYITLNHENNIITTKFN